jgi:hypothetical protein
VSNSGEIHPSAINVGKAVGVADRRVLLPASECATSPSRRVSRRQIIREYTSITNAGTVALVERVASMSPIRAEVQMHAASSSCGDTEPSMVEISSHLRRCGPCRERLRPTDRCADGDEGRGPCFEGRQ